MIYQLKKWCKNYFYCSIYIWYNLKALVPLTNKLKDKDKFMLQSLFGTKSTFTCYPTRHLKFGYILFLKNLLQTANEMKFNYVQLDQLKKIKRTKKRLKRNIKML